MNNALHALRLLDDVVGQGRRPAGSGDDGGMWKHNPHETHTHTHASGRETLSSRADPGDGIDSEVQPEQQGKKKGQVKAELERPADSRGAGETSFLPLLPRAAGSQVHQTAG